jgi:hypothetical protein
VANTPFTYVRRLDTQVATFKIGTRVALRVLDTRAHGRDHEEDAEPLES